MDLTQFSSEKFEEGVTFYPELPNGDISESHIKIRSVKSEAAIEFTGKLTKKAQLDEFNANLNNKANLASIDQAIKNDIGYAVTLIIDFGDFSADGQKITDAKDLMTKFPWMRKQVIEQAKVDDSFFGL